MTKRASWGCVFVLCVAGVACSKSGGTGGGTGGMPGGTGAVGVLTGGTGGSLGASGTGGGMAMTGMAAVGGVKATGGTGGMGTGGIKGTGGMGTGGMGTGGMGTGGMGTGGMGIGGMGTGGMGTGGMGTGGMGTGGMSASGGNSATGMLCTLGAVKPIVSALITANSGETLVYLSTVPLTCTQMMASRWLGSTTAGGQMIEIVIGPAAGGTSPSVNMAISTGLLAGEVNFAPTGGSSGAETTAASGSITFTKFMAMGPAEGTFMASYGCGGMVMGTFKAEFCNGGQGY
jgi:hypothetical protein